jgi:hypothetical protein
LSVCPRPAYPRNTTETAAAAPKMIQMAKRRPRSLARADLARAHASTGGRISDEGEQLDSASRSRYQSSSATLGARRMKYQIPTVQPAT